MRNFCRGVVLKVFYPMLMLAGAFSKDNKEKLQLFVIDISNRLVRAKGVKTKKILLLLPHCLQVGNCDVRITHNIYNCKGCGRCEVKDLIQIAKDNNLKLFVATGGTIARRIVEDARPEAIIAVACERDLISGIVDTYPLPVLGISNERPFGPCLDTQVDLTKVKEAIEFFGKGRAL